MSVVLGLDLRPQERKRYEEICLRRLKYGYPETRHCLRRNATYTRDKAKELREKCWATFEARLLDSKQAANAIGCSVSTARYFRRKYFTEHPEIKRDFIAAQKLRDVVEERAFKAFSEGRFEVGSVAKEVGCSRSKIYKCRTKFASEHPDAAETIKKIGRAAMGANARLSRENFWNKRDLK